MIECAWIRTRWRMWSRTSCSRSSEESDDVLRESPNVYIMSCISVWYLARLLLPPSPTTTRSLSFFLSAIVVEAAILSWVRDGWMSMCDERDGWVCATRERWMGMCDERDGWMDGYVRRERWMDGWVCASGVMDGYVRLEWWMGMCDCSGMRRERTLCAVWSHLLAIFKPAFFYGTAPLAPALPCPPPPSAHKPL